jgi:putative membrane protein
LIDDEETPMRWIYLAVIVLIAAATIVFALQNFEIVTMSFLGFNGRVPLALVVAVAYLLGTATGGSPRAAASIVRRVETKHRGFILN